jgi:hypothetical protein
MSMAAMAEPIMINDTEVKTVKTEAPKGPTPEEIFASQAHSAIMDILKKATTEAEAKKAIIRAGMFKHRRFQISGLVFRKSFRTVRVVFDGGPNCQVTTDI